MKNSTATAPGKLILFGEHAVVYGRPALAVPVLDLQAQARLEAAPAGSGFRIVAPDLGRDYRLVQAQVDDPLAQIVRQTLAHLQQSPPPARLTVSATLPLGRGLGSGAAISTAIVRALADFFEQPLSPAQISALVFEAEKLYHGTPSGIDNTVVAFEQPVYFIKGRPLERLSVAAPFTLVGADTGLAASTRVVVAGVRRRRQAEPDRYEGYFDEIGALAAQARVLIERGEVNLSALGKLMDENQEILARLGVSSPELERLIEAARQAGALGAKLSGAGQGGHMIALVPPEPAVIEGVEQALSQAGAVKTFVTTVTEQ